MAIGRNVINIDGYVGRRIAITGGEVEILSKSNDRIDAVLTNRGTASVFLGATGVTDASGYELSAGGTVTVPGQGILFGIVTAGSHVVHVLEAQNV